tara:strand:- start:1432 stop:2460 length:1029 start_codon:yes stop_codon:yes gene_type:complete
MKNAFATRALQSFWDLTADLADSLASTFEDCGETKDWQLYVKNVVMGDESRMMTGVQKWCEGMEAPLAKGAAKYAKAIQSLTGAPATVYHAIAYKDVAAADASFETLQALRLPEKLASDKMDDASKALFWKYFEELNRHAYTVTGKTAPAVPTSEAIAADIACRRGAQAGGGGGGGALQQGLGEVWKRLCALRGVQDAAEAVALEKAAAAPFSQEGGAATVGEGCRARAAAAFAALAAEMRLGDAPPTEEQWALLDRALGLVTMEGAISAPMMRNIESVANQLVQDLANGKADLSTLNIEALGQQVLSQVSQEDVSSFAQNLDKIIPALDGLHQPQPPRSTG